MRAAALAILLLIPLASPGEEIYHWRNFTRMEGLCGNDVRAVYQDSYGRIWVGTGSGVSVFDGMWRSYSTADGLISDDVRVICQDSYGRIWVGTSRGVSVFNGERWKSRTFGDDPFANYVLSIKAEGENVWVGTYRGVNRFDGREWELWGENEGRLDLGVRAVLRDSSGRLWFGMEASALYSVLVSRFDGSSWRRFTATDGLPEGSVLALAEDEEGRIWAAASMGVGVFEGESWHKLFSLFPPEWIVSLTIDSEGRVWVLSTKWLARYEGGKWSYVALPEGADDPQCLLVDQFGSIWIGTKRNGLFFCDRGVRIFKTPPVSSVAVDGMGRVWVGTVEGVEVIDGEEVHHLPLGEVRSLFGTERGVWVGLKGGLVLVEGDPPVEVRRVADLPYDDVRAVYVDSTGKLWAGVGLFVSGPGGIANRFSALAEITPSGDVKIHPLDYTPSSIAEDGFGRIWVGTFGGGVAAIEGDKW
ncbi:hypothetical protein DRP77_00005, partial [Candidatus Poribacteria bacterium]